MPSIAITESQRRAEHIKRVSRWAKGKLAENDYDQKDLADYICESESKVSRRFSGNNVSLSMLLGVIEMCNVQPDEMERVLGRK